MSSYTNDGLGNQSTLLSPDTGTTRRTYDLGGNLETSTDARNQTTTYTNDALNRVTGISYTTGTATVLEYDGGCINKVESRPSVVQERKTRTLKTSALARKAGRKTISVKLRF